MVDPGLAPDARIDLRNPGGGDVDRGDAAQVGRRGESGEVADDAAAQGQQRVTALESPSDQLVIDATEGTKRLVALAIGYGDEKRSEPRRLHTREDALAVQRADPRVGHDPPP